VGCGFTDPYYCDEQRMVIEGVKSALGAYRDLEVVGEALNGHQAIEKVKSLKPDIVILGIAIFISYLIITLIFKEAKGVYR
jgi:DNA-binding NarL/FixJ family response regulator